MAQIVKLEIARGDAWSSNKGQLQGKVCVVGEDGSQEIRLTAVTIASIFNLVRDQATKTALLNARQVDSAIAEASAEASLLENKNAIEMEV